MVKQIEIHDKDYKDFELLDLTDNTIIFFSKPYLKNKVLKKIGVIWQYGNQDKDDDSIIYICETPEEQDPRINLSKNNISYLPTSIINLQGGQRFIFTVEAPFIFQAKAKYDIWFVDDNPEYTKDGDEPQNITCWAFTDFKGHNEVWNAGLDSVYSEFCQGRYGCYQGYYNG